MALRESAFRDLIHSITGGDIQAAKRLIAQAPDVVDARASSDVFLEDIAHYMYEGDTALHIAAAAYRHEIAEVLLSNGADVRATNRRGAQPLHYAADGGPGSRSWNPPAQVGTIALLIEAGADPNAADKSGVMPLHRAARTRCAAAVQALLEGGADPRIKNKNGSTPLDLAARSTGRGGTGSQEAKAQQAEIIHFLNQHHD